MPLVLGEEENVGTRRIHLVRLPWMNCLLLHSLDLEGIELLVEDLTEIHDDRLMNLLPQVSTEDLDQRDLQSRNLSVHEDARQVELHLETDIDLKPITFDGTAKQTLARLIVGDHQRVKRRFGIWLRPERCALVSFLNFIDSSKPEARSQKRPSHVGK